MLPVKYQDILPFDIRKFNIKMNKKIVDWIYVAYRQVLWIS